ncbi:MAG: hypothetical protein VYC82_05925, partial [Verrucomicrobiota bacterium]|nr:hypothetical protein [Verrucomicrobiota bacterium]
AKCGVSLKEIEDSGYWLELLIDAEIVPGSKLTNLRDETNRLLADIHRNIEESEVSNFIIHPSSFNLSTPCN